MRYAFAVTGLVAAATAGKVTLTATEEVTITSCAPTHTACPYSNKHDWESWEDPSEDASTTAWGSWDPKSPVASSTATWGSWDPETPVASSTATWSAWDESDPKASTSWGAWDPAKSTAASTWASWDPEDAASSTTAWGTWDPAKSTATATATWTAWEGSDDSSAAECPKYTATAPPAWFSQLPTSVLSSLAAKWTGAPPADWCYYSYSNGVVTQTKTPDAAAASSTWAAWSTGAGATGVKGATATGAAPVAKYTGAASANAASFVLAGAAAVAAVVLA